MRQRVAVPVVAIQTGSSDLVPQVGEELVVGGETVDEELSGDGQQFDDLGVGDGVRDRGAFAAAGDHAGASEHSELMGEVGGLQADEWHELADGPAAVAEDLEHADRPGWASALKRSALISERGLLAKISP